MCGWPMFTSGAPAHQKFPSNQKFPFMDIPNTLPFMPHLPLVQQVTVSAFQNNTKHEKIGRTEIYHIWAQNIPYMGAEYNTYGHRIYHIWAQNIPYMSVPLEPSLYSFDSDGKGHHLTRNETSRLHITHLVTMDMRDRERERE